MSGSPWCQKEDGSQLDSYKLRKHIILLLHDSPLGAHRDRDRTRDAILDAGLWRSNMRMSLYFFCWVSWLVLTLCCHPPTPFRGYIYIYSHTYLSRYLSSEGINWVSVCVCVCLCVCLFYCLKNCFKSYVNYSEFESLLQIIWFLQGIWTRGFKFIVIYIWLEALFQIHCNLHMI